MCKHMADGRGCKGGDASAVKNQILESLGIGRNTMELPANFESPPSEELHRAFRNTCIEFRKLLKTSKNIPELNQQMEKFIGESKQMHWHSKNTSVYRKDEGKKLADKILSEFKRYMTDLEPYLNRADPAPVIEALKLMEQYIHNYRVT